MQAPEAFLAKLRTLRPKADLFTFAQSVCNVERKHPYHMEWDNAAVVRTESFKKWWEKDLPQVTRKNVRRSQKRGVVVRPMVLGDETVASIFKLYNSIEIKQGAQFAHRGKDYETVKRELSTFAERCEFIGAYHEDELIGFIKLVHMGKNAGIMHIVTRDRDYDKRPANALIAKAVENCEASGKSYLIYGKYAYGNKTSSPLTEYKRRSGFERICFPRYYIPLNLKGKIVIKLGLHRGLLGLLPGSVINLLLRLRSWVLRHLTFRLRAVGEVRCPISDNKAAKGTD